MMQPLVLPIIHATQNTPLREAPLPEHSRTPLQKMQTLPLTRRASDPNICNSIRRQQLPQVFVPPQHRIQPPNARSERNELYKLPSVMPNIIPRPQTPALEIDAPPPEMFVDTESGRYGIRCICGNQVNEGLMIQCSKCGFWVHAICVNIARAQSTDTYLCPFCKRRPLRCKCGDARKYDEPMIQCPKCKYWAHKRCLLLGYGRNPPNYACQNCGGYISVLPPLGMTPESGVSNITAFITSNKTTLIQQIPEGPFRNSVISDLNKGEINLYDTMTRYFSLFFEPIFAEDPDFWRIFTKIMVELLGCTEKAIFDSLDFLANQFLYKPMPETPPLFVALNKFSMSERASLILEDPSILPQLPRFDKPNGTPPVKLVKKGQTMGIFTENNIDENGFICEIPGFLCYYTEMDTSEGLLKRWISIPNSDFVIDTDTDKTCFTLCPSIRRSFFYNCTPKIMVMNTGEVRVILVAHRMKGPNIHESSSKSFKKGPAILAGSELFLPLDSDLPYIVQQSEWRQKKTRGGRHSSSKTNSSSNSSHSNNPTSSSSTHNNNQHSNAHNLHSNSQMQKENSSKDGSTSGGSTKDGTSGRQHAHITRSMEKAKNDMRPAVPCLLSLFYDSSAPPLPLQVLTEEEVKIKDRVREKTIKSKSRISTRRSTRHIDDDDSE
ncbi:hypothetical protein TRFO_14281 [Tritrichomonas foetus]|uniref:PHD-type domain-containing protein n=1 Tax=Tritrichomonas foetus TaxID=1144522 RepID=A0A1J4L065_9EUKA|nr:hypothetical protein TRFO_14281 [Tritrichomonas foetus]|eukprot:OHT15245.1 hypothetical protein TRFO_14281 [Tritrichomonas foetus]